jgi:hypothetical protein
MQPCSSTNPISQAQVGSPLGVFVLVVHTTLVLFNVVVLTTVSVVVIVGVGTFEVLVLLTRTVETGSVVVSRSVLRTIFCTVSVVPS